MEHLLASPGICLSLTWGQEEEGPYDWKANMSKGVDGGCGNKPLLLKAKKPAGKGGDLMLSRQAGVSLWKELSDFFAFYSYCYLW